MVGVFSVNYKPNVPWLTREVVDYRKRAVCSFINIHVTFEQVYPLKNHSFVTLY